MRFQSSVYSGVYGAYTAKQAVSDTGTVAATSAAAYTAGTGAVVGANALLASAGIAATVPVAGWIVGGVLAGAAGIWAISDAYKANKAKKKGTKRALKKLGFSPTESFEYMKKLKGMTPKDRREELVSLKRRKAALEGKTGDKAKNDLKEVKWKLKLANGFVQTDRPKSSLSPDERKFVDTVRRAPADLADNDEDEDSKKKEEGFTGPLLMTLLVGSAAIAVLTILTYKKQKKA